MCFSADADLAAGLVVTVSRGGRGSGGRRPRRNSPSPHSRSCSASTSSSRHSCGGVCEGKVPSRVGDAATWLYLAMAFALPFSGPVRHAWRGGVPSPANGHHGARRCSGAGHVAGPARVDRVGPSRLPPSRAITRVLPVHPRRREHQRPVRHRDVRRAPDGERSMNSPRLRRVEPARGGTPGLADGRGPHVAVVRVGRHHQRRNRPVLPRRRAPRAPDHHLSGFEAASDVVR